MLTKTQTKNMITWINALESGKYQAERCSLYTGKNRTKTKKRMCCLGVACDIFIKDKWKELDGQFMKLGQRHVAPKSLIKKLGLDSDCGWECSTEMLLTDMNDLQPNKNYKAVLPHIKERLKTLGHKSMKKQISKICG